MNSEQRRPSGRQETGTAARDAAPVAIGSCEDAQRILQSLRDELDGLDRTLLETVRRRLDCCCRIGLHKRDHAIPMMQPHRIGVVQERAAAFAAEHGVSPTFLRALYELIITETCRLEDEIIGTPSTSA
ncbi:chorismate mutase [Variovorax boronicumulans]|uniref:chorismate mutase n=1 Tax=Variovorax boronicumulans TaxID=436515 RepID=A0AAW8CKY0_9BURK|nr:chorismate mutase family protein [Variovorax boronicumulans]MDP9890994.1 chorismate mutase [Variovorax boronicumulans]MDQ0036041.1 chorismate mutase [Variovorax boronicumulans]MDQ0051061.1 chorismate mutase [Variovorax boronicumulans]